MSPSITWWTRRLLAAWEVGFWAPCASVWLVIVMATSARMGVPSMRNSVYFTVALVRNPRRWSSCGLPPHLNWTSGGRWRPSEPDAFVGCIQLSSVVILGVTSPLASENASKNRLVAKVIAAVPPYCCCPPTRLALGVAGTETVWVRV